MVIGCELCAGKGYRARYTPVIKKGSCSFSIGDDVIVRRPISWNGRAKGNKPPYVNRIPGKIVGAHWQVWLVDTEYGQMTIDARTGESRYMFEGYIPEMATGSHRAEISRDLDGLDLLTPADLLNELAHRTTYTLSRREIDMILGMNPAELDYYDRTEPTWTSTPSTK